MAGKVSQVLNEIYAELAQASRTRESTEQLRMVVGGRIKGFSGRKMAELLCEACNVGDVSLVHALLRNGADPNVRSSVHNPNTALAIALCGDSAEVLDLLLDFGAEIERKDAEGWTPLAWAAYMGTAGFVKKLLARGANPDTRSSGWTPLMHALSEKEVACAEVLVGVSNLKIKSMSPNPLHRVNAYEFAKSCGLDGVAGLIEARLSSIKEKKVLEKGLGEGLVAEGRKRSANI